MTLSEAQKCRFWDKVEKLGNESGCWLWTASVSNAGYGVFGVNYKMKTAHRISWALVHGPIPEGAFVCHRCDTRDCVNPNHLFLGNSVVNMRDKVSKGRQIKGEGVVVSKLNPEKVRSIRREYRPGVVSFRMLAAKYGCGNGAIRDIIENLTWTHIK